MPQIKTPSLFELLEAQNRLSETSRKHAQALAAETGEKEDRVLTQLGLLTEKEIAETLATALDIPLLDSLDGIVVDQGLNCRVNLSFLASHRSILYTDEKSAPSLAQVNPLNEDARLGIQAALGHPVQITVVTETAWRRAFETIAAPAEVQSENPDDDFDVSADVHRLKDLASEEPVVRLVNRLISGASRARSSDIHFEPGPRDTEIKFRIDGILRHHDTLSKGLGLAAVSRIKILAELDIAERRRPQDGRFAFPLEGRKIDLRVSTLATDNGESLVLRLLDPGAVQLNWDTLGFDAANIETIHRMIARPHGILLVTGPTGSGKTTTLYTMLQELATGERKILTIEDPIEYRLGGVSQTQVNPAIDLTFAKGLRSFLRHDPDVMMVGEIRDLETARVAVQAAMTGHLVLSTLHTNDAASSISRLIEMGVEDYLVSATLIGIIAQRLVPKRCDTCHGQRNKQETESCPSCHGTGVSGRTAIVEILEMTDDLRRAVASAQDPQSIQEQCRAIGFQSLHENGLEKAHKGEVAIKDIVKAVGNNDHNSLSVFGGGSHR